VTSSSTTANAKQTLTPRRFVEEEEDQDEKRSDIGVRRKARQRDGGAMSYDKVPESYPPPGYSQPYPPPQAPPQGPYYPPPQQPPPGYQGYFNDGQQPYGYPPPHGGHHHHGHHHHHEDDCCLGFLKGWLAALCCCCVLDECCFCCF
ncbi:unnamed protein product, partial [Urochloa humidicola]